eukprot:gnl/MRDRNA2_/MRDRNA2_28847_c0_seq1.p1 gnl/MRDRNA2_/MRDRNA2_28847_c0~~gnl/MRDRNA2_/MRDRNA2_28847_c0_seq1.p1  ORF type:complete len:626 (-),score=234.78 gnl/MRDRNA2_/MRDRNA2_28847_c0_seq1:60-1937(-)
MSAAQMEMIQMSVVELKEARAVHRATHLRKKRSEYVRSLSVACKPAWLPKSLVPTTRERNSQQHSRSTHGATRAATRTSICNETKIDLANHMMEALPATELGSMPRSVVDHTMIVVTKDLECEIDNAETTAAEDSASDSCDSTKTTPKTTFNAEDASLSERLSANVLDLAETSSAQDDDSSEQISLESVQIAANEEMAEIKEEPLQKCEPSLETQAKDIENFEKRKAIFQNVVAAQQQMLREAEKTVLAAQAEAGQARTELDKLAKSGVDRKQALQMEKQRSNEVRRKRNQAAQIQAMMETAERHKLEAQALREEAEAEVLISKARLLAEAEANAQAETQARVREAELRAQAEMEAKAKEAEAVRAQLLAEAEAAALLAQEQAKQEALALKAKAEAELQEQIKAEVEAAKSKADKEAQAVKEKALHDAIALKERAENQLKAREARAREEAAAEAERQAQEAAAEAERRAQKEAAQAIKQAKMLQQARSKEIKKKAQQELELQKQRAKLEDEKSKVQAEADRIRVEAEMHMRLCEEARIKAEREAEAKKAAAEAEAQKIKTEADEQAKALKVKIQNARKELEAALRSELAAEAANAAVAALDAEWTLIGRTEQEQTEYFGDWEELV